MTTAFDPDAELDTHNWFNYQSFYSALARAPGLRRFAEVGVWKGHAVSFLARELLTRTDQFEIYAIDLWERHPLGESWFAYTPHIYEIYNRNLERAGVRHKIVDVKEDSARAAARFPDGFFDAVFIDAAHDEGSVRRDIAAWRPKVRPGGILAGHDYGEPCAVKAVVDELFGNRISVIGTVWRHDAPHATAAAA